MVTLKWKNGEVPSNLKIKQVYGLLFSDDGRILLRIENKPERKFYSLAGGKPEKFDDGNEGTLCRECVEEINTTLKNPILTVGYCEVDEGDGTPIYAQLRMTALIEKIGKKQPDPDGGEIYDRILTTPQRAIELLKWGDVGELMIEEAVKVAKQNFKFKNISTKEEYV